MKLTAVFLITCLVFSATLFAQNEDQQKDSINSFETMYVHFDKDIYLPGETIWFKAYLYNVNELSFLATNFYAAIYDENGNLLYKKQYPILSGSCNGDFEIPEILSGNRIQFRAFTKAMLLEDSNNVYTKTIAVYNKENNNDSKEINKVQTLQFFPEGGKIIAELQNYIGFRATYNDGTPAIINGQIIEANRNRIVDTFFTNASGLGKFMLIPSPRTKYFAIWKDENGITIKTPLPNIYRYGVSLHTEIKNKELQYTLAKNRSSDSLSLLHVQAQMGNYKIYSADLQLQNEMELSVAKFSVDSLPSGLLQLTLFDKNWNILQQSLVFINEMVTNKPVIIIDSVNTKARAKNSIEIILKDTTLTNLSVSVADVNFYNPIESPSIQQTLLLHSQIKDLNQKIDSSLQNNNIEQLNLITLTHEWKKFNWQKVINKNILLPKLLDNYISLIIHYKQKDLALPQDDALNLILNTSATGKQFYNLKPSSSNNFTKNDLIFYDSIKVFYQMDKAKELASFLSISKDDTLTIPSSIAPLKKSNHFATAQPIKEHKAIDLFTNNYTSTFNNEKTIKEVVVKSRYKGNPMLERIDELDKFYTSGMFSGTVKGFQLNVIDDTLGVAANRDLKDYIRYRFPGLKLYENKFGEKRTIVTNRKGKIVVVDTICLVKIFVNEADVTPEPIVTSSGTISAGDPFELLSMNEIAYVKYIPGIVIGSGFMSSFGAIYIYTKNGKEKGPAIKGLPYVYIKGYNTQKEFINPDYNNNAILKQPDLRTTLYWNPNVILDQINNSIKIIYYNNDISKKLLLKIEGVTAKGKLIYAEKIIE